MENIIRATHGPHCLTEEREIHRIPHWGSVLQEAGKWRREGGCVLGHCMMAVMEGHKGIAERICLVHAARITIDIK